MSNLLSIENLKVNYGGIEAVKGVSMTVEEGQIVTLIGANGAGKSTILRTISGLVKPASGTVTFQGEDITGKDATDIVMRGITMSPEGRRIFPDMTVDENLRIGAYLRTDDITPEKLASVLAENDGRMALLSSEAGIFDTLAGAYSKSVNIDVMLKSYSGDQIRVDRIGRESENILNPTLTVLLMAQPNVISRVLSNETFRGRGLTARFLYCMPASAVGGRRYRSEPVPDDVYAAYERCVFNMLEDDYGSAPEIITLSPEADALMEAFSQELEPKLVKEYAEIADWCGKLAGNTLRIAGLLCRAATHRGHDFLDVPEPLVVDGQTMANAIRLGKYFLNHAQAIFNVLPENAMFRNAHRILKMIYEKGLKEFNRRTAMRNCQTFKRVEEIQPVLDFLEDYGYIAPVEAPPTFGKGRPAMPKYIVNPWVEQYYCHTVMGTVIPSTDTIIT